MVTRAQGQGKQIVMEFGMDVYTLLYFKWIGTSLVVQWLRLHAPNAGGLDSIPGMGTRSHMLQLRSDTAK